ncbi:PBP1A family penicillin-binding protein [Pseudochelatococcus contaminans]|uniref:Penicillin-binding protein 1A n=1 Tax=Pseudochelatococcus contaminans TaxID=1538103 RepID=A0A7W6EHB8_9HYPH|nr:penicillin-binding protein 1A [Pseudochelatococcus contaminans]
MFNYRKVPFLTRLKRAALVADSWIDASLYNAGSALGEVWRRISAQTDRLAVTGMRRVAVEIASEGATLSVAGGMLLLALSQPAFRETTEDWLKKPEFAVTFLDRYGTEIGRRGILHDDSLELSEFPEVLVKAVLATEDRRFYQHFGIDLVGTLRALSANARADGVVQGGSSITQQLAKNLFLTNERSIQRKINEAFLSLWLESRLTKNEILKLYLDRAYMGGGTFGAAAAAEFYFGKSVRDVTLPEAAMLAGLFKAPSKYAPHVNLPTARSRASDVLGTMVKAGFISEGQAEIARRNPATPMDRGRDASPDYYLDWAFDEIRAMAGEGALHGERVLVVRTPLDLSIQHMADTALEEGLLQEGKRWGVKQGAIAVLSPDGAARAMVGGRDYGESQFNRATGSLRQPGSSFKPFVFAAAMTDGLVKEDSMIVDGPTCIGNWCPNNYGRSFAGRMTLTTALQRSVNTTPVRLTLMMGHGNARKGLERVIEMSHLMGITTELRNTAPLPIGAEGVRVLDMAAGFAAFSNGGYRAKPYAAIEISNGHGDIIWSRSKDAPTPERILPPEVAEGMNRMMIKVVEAGTGRRARIDGVPVAGKTGTTNAYRDAWFVGYTGNLVASVWLGNDDYKPANRMTGGTLPAQIWKAMMLPAHAGQTIRPMPGVTPGAEAIAAAPAEAGENVDAANLSRQSWELLQGLDALFREAESSGSQPTTAGAGGEVPSGVSQDKTAKDDTSQDSPQRLAARNVPAQAPNPP